MSPLMTKHTFWLAKKNARKGFDIFKKKVCTSNLKLKQIEGFWYALVALSAGGFVILTALLSLLCARKCAFFFNLTLNALILLAVLGVSGWFGYMDYLNWMIVGSTMIGAGVLLLIVIISACCGCNQW